MIADEELEGSTPLVFREQDEWVSEDCRARWNGGLNLFEPRCELVKLLLSEKEPKTLNVEKLGPVQLGLWESNSARDSFQKNSRDRKLTNLPIF